MQPIRASPSHTVPWDDPAPAGHSSPAAQRPSDFKVYQLPDSPPLRPGEIR